MRSPAAVLAGLLVAGPAMAATSPECTQAIAEALSLRAELEALKPGGAELKAKNALTPPASAIVSGEGPEAQKVRAERSALFQDLRTRFETFKAKRSALTRRLDSLMGADDRCRVASNELSGEGFVGVMNQVGAAISDANVAVATEKAQTAEANRLLEPAPDPRSLRGREVHPGRGARALFELAHPSRFVFALSDIKDKDRANWGLPRTLVKGEPLLVVGHSSNPAVLTIDGIGATLFASDLGLAPLSTSSPHPLKPAWLTVQDDEGYVGGPLEFVEDKTGRTLNKAPFLRALEPSDPRLETFVNARQKVLDCYEAEMKRLDPDGVRGGYDLVEVRADGTRKVVETLDSAFDRTACKKCGCKAFNDARRKLAKDVLTPLQEKKFAELKPALERVNGLSKK